MDTRDFYKSRLRAKGQVTLPSEVRELLEANEGDDLVFRTDESGQVVVERARIIPPDQAWFWTARWQRMEQEAQADIEAGRVHRYANVDEAVADLEP
ncbi:MAG TPA: AbrB/MazE/SpoVT family DNA-binding domain-containing protein [Anaerolineales bacterium]|nr:AbrB/MazE/SpoVT family DNA-binding domain-containing protein [Anaerolineales bacterium]